jgi:hypothetical protein
VGTVSDTTTDPKTLAAMDMLRRTGAAEVQVRYSDDEQPTVWLAVSRYRLGGDGRPKPTGPINGSEVAAGRNPTEALLRLCERVMDGGSAPLRQALDVLRRPRRQPHPLDAAFCITSWDPELSTFRRSCEGN